eukprot:SAG31_NODE_39955_length_284_cov_0.837838_1_plen_20_part_10
MEGALLAAPVVYRHRMRALV